MTQPLELIDIAEGPVGARNAAGSGDLLTGRSGRERVGLVGGEERGLFLVRSPVRVSRFEQALNHLVRREGERDPLAVLRGTVGGGHAEHHGRVDVGAVGVEFDILGRKVVLTVDVDRFLVTSGWTSGWLDKRLDKPLDEPSVSQCLILV